MCWDGSNTKTEGERDSSNAEFITDVAMTNVNEGLNTIRQSTVIRKLIENGSIKVTGGMYNTETGKIKFFEE
ncbi:MAG: carbonic anhydrase [bacterium]|nr:carbonic anhydrase [bacterium]